MKYDLIVVGGGTAGCACAYTAAKLGARVLLIEKNSFLGGMMTGGLVTPAMKTSSKNINTDYFNLIMKELNKIGGQITYKDGNIGWFNPELLKIVLDRVMDSVGVHVLFNTKIDEILKDKNHILKVKVENSLKNIDTIYANNINNLKILSEYIETDYLVDATGDAKIFEKLNCEFLEKNNNFQQPNLRFIMGGVNINKFAKWLEEIDPSEDTSIYKTSSQIHLSTAYTWDTNKKWALEPVFKAGIEKGEITEEDSNYFQVFTIPGMPDSIAFNCPRILIEDELNIKDKVLYSEVLKRGRASILRLSVFLKNNFKGFENSYISKVSDSLGIRLSNRIKGEYIYTVDDIMTGKTFEHPCLISDYPIDIHSKNKNKSVLSKLSKEYMLPLEALKSCEYDNLYAIGRCISADFEALAALRIIPSCCSMGEGLAKHLCSKIISK